MIPPQQISMKIAGKKIENANIEICVLPRGTGEPLVFKAASVLDMSPFEKLCPRPTPPVKIVKGGKRIEDFESPTYKNSVNDYAEKRMLYLILKSLEATEGLEWETVDLSDYTTWKNYESELLAAGINDIEKSRIVNTVLQANCLSEERLEQARNDFLSMEATRSELSSHKEEQPATQSGEPVKESA